MERRRNPPGTTGFLGSYRVMKSTAKPGPHAKANRAAEGSIPDRIIGLLKKEEDHIPPHHQEQSHWDKGMEPRQVEGTHTGARITGMARQERSQHLQPDHAPLPTSEWDPQPQPHDESLIGDYAEPAPTGWNSAGLESSSGW